MKYAHINGVENPKVGETYLVPTLHRKPVIGTPHLDDFVTAFDVPRHYHIDNRFAEGDAVLADETPRDDLWVCKSNAIPEWEFDKGLIVMEVTLDFAKCKTKHGRCPHQGMPIINGVCSGHRLKFCGDRPRHQGPFILRCIEADAAFQVSRIRDLQDLRVYRDGDYQTFQLYDVEGEFCAEFSLDEPRKCQIGDTLKVAMPNK